MRATTRNGRKSGRKKRKRRFTQNKHELCIVVTGKEYSRLADKLQYNVGLRQFIIQLIIL